MLYCTKCIVASSPTKILTTLCNPAILIYLRMHLTNLFVNMHNNLFRNYNICIGNSLYLNRVL